MKVKNLLTSIYILFDTATIVYKIVAFLNRILYENTIFCLCVWALARGPAVPAAHIAPQVLAPPWEAQHDQPGQDQAGPPEK